MIFRVALLLFLLTSCQEQEEGVPVAYRELTEAVYGTATVTPRHSYTVYPPVSGIIETSSLRVGNKVAAGDDLFKISTTQAAINQQKAALNLEQARADYQGEVAVLRELEEKLASARIKLQHDSLNYARQARLWEQNIGSKQQYEGMHLAYQTSRNTSRELQNSYLRTKRELANRVALAKNALALSANNYGDHYVHAAIDGTVYQVFKDIGESVGPQTPVAEVGSTDDFLINILVDEVDIARIETGQSVVILLDAYGQETFSATIQRVLPLKDARSQTFTVEAEFTTPPPRLYSGLSGEANIIITQRSGILTLPSQYINENNQVLTAGGLRQITPGLSDLRYTEIVSGLEEGDVVYQAE